MNCPEAVGDGQKDLQRSAVTCFDRRQRYIRMHFVCSSFLGRPTSLRSSIIGSSSSRPCPLSVLLLRLPFRPSSIFFWLTHVHALIFFLATAWHKSSSRSTPKIRHSRLGFQRAHECTEILLIEVALESEEKEKSCRHRQFSSLEFNLHL